MDIQYHHSNFLTLQKKTYAVLLPTAVMFTELLENPERSITLGVGVAFCSPKDQYRKATGRELAANRISNVTYNLRSMHFEGENIFFHLHCGSLSRLILKMSPRSERLHLIQAY